jgi:hypothetical protein
MQELTDQGYSGHISLLTSGLVFCRGLINVKISPGVVWDFGKELLSFEFASFSICSEFIVNNGISLER